MSLLYDGLILLCGGLVTAALALWEQARHGQPAAAAAAEGHQPYSTAAAAAAAEPAYPPVLGCKQHCVLLWQPALHLLLLRYRGCPWQ
jgi:hypothetical protein